MEQYLGTEAQVRLQRRADAYSDWLYATPGACHTGRFLGTDDPDRLGWDTVLKHLRHDKVFGFRMVPVEDVFLLRERLARNGFRIDFWNVYSAAAADILDTCRAHVEAPLPDGLTRVVDLDDAETIRRIQECVLRNGMAPFSGRMLSGQATPSSTVALRDGAGHIVATAYGYKPYNQHSAHHTTAWGGLVAVDKSQRGKGLGVRVNAMMLSDCAAELGAQHVQEFVSDDNVPSRRMVQRCGLALDAAVKCGIATSAGERFTR